MRAVVSLYSLDLQKLSPETGSPRREHCHEFSERRNRFVCYLRGCHRAPKIPCHQAEKFTCRCTMFALTPQLLLPRQPWTAWPYMTLREVERYPPRWTLGLPPRKIPRKCPVHDGRVTFPGAVCFPLHGVDKALLDMVRLACELAVWGIILL